MTCTSLLLFLSLGSFSSRTIQRAAKDMSNPWPTSPNITANRKGNVIMVYTAAEARKGKKRKRLNKLVAFDLCFNRVIWWIKWQRQTWIDLPVTGHSVSVNNALETSCEGVEGEQSGRRGGAGQAVVEGVHAAATLPLKMEGKAAHQLFYFTKSNLQQHCMSLICCCVHLTPPSLRALCSSGSLAVGHQASAIRHLSVTEGLQRFSTSWMALHFWTRTFHWGRRATARCSSCCRKASVWDNTWKTRWGSENREFSNRLTREDIKKGTLPHSLNTFGTFGVSKKRKCWYWCRNKQKKGTHWFDVFNPTLKALQNFFSLSCTLWVYKCLRVEAARHKNK